MQRGFPCVPQWAKDWNQVISAAGTLAAFVQGQEATISGVITATLDTMALLKHFLPKPRSALPNPRDSPRHPRVRILHFHPRVRILSPPCADLPFHPRVRARKPSPVVIYV